MRAAVMMRRHTARAHAEGGEGLNLEISSIQNRNGGAGWLPPCFASPPPTFTAPCSSQLT